MKLTTLLILLALSSCSLLPQNRVETKPPRIKKISSSKKVIEAKKNNPKPEITGELTSGVEYEATPGPEGFVISFDPFIETNDAVVMSATAQIITRLYNDKIKGESHISIESNIDYAIFKGVKARYRIVPFKESNGEISSMTITSIL